MADPLPGRLRAFAREVSRRRVVRVAIVYAVVGYGVMQVAANFFPALQLPSWTLTFTAALVILGFPVALALAWAYDITPEGVKRTGPAPDGGRSPAAPRRHPGAAYMGAGMLLAIVVLGLSYNAITDKDEAVESRSIAVLPFANFNGGDENEAFSDGLTEELLNALAQVEGLRVPARTSSFAFKNVNSDISEIGRKLNVELLLEGSVRRAGDRLRITVQLIRAQDGAHVWSETFDRELADIFAIQEEIAAGIVRQVMPRVHRTRDAAERMRNATADLTAYDAYLKGRHQFWQQSGEQGLRAAAAFFEDAVTRDSTYAIAWAGLADAYMLLGGSGFVPPHEIFPQSKAAAERALTLDDRLAEGYVALASINWLYEWDWESAARNYRASFSVNPLLHTRCICYAWYLAVTGDIDAAVLEAERARSLDPLARLPRVIASWMYYLAGRSEQARVELAEIFALNPSDVAARRITAWLLWEEGRREDAIAELEQVRTAADARGGFAQTGSPVVVAELASMYARAGRRTDAAALLSTLRARSRRQYIPAEYAAAIHGALGEHDEAREWLEHALSDRSNLAQFNVLPLSEPLRRQTYYQQVIARVALPSQVHNLRPTGD